MEANLKKIFYKIIFIVFLIFLFLAYIKGCDGNNVKKNSIIIKEQKGSFVYVKPKQEDVIKDTKNIKKKQNLSNNEEFLQSKINELLNENDKLNIAYNNASDSLKNAIYNNAIAIKSFNHVFDNDTINITANGLIRGEIQSINVDYKIKSKIIEIPKPKETVLRVLAGINVGNNKSLNDFDIKFNLGIQNRKGNIISAGYDSNKKIYIGYSISLLNIKGK